MGLDWFSWRLWGVDRMTRIDRIRKPILSIPVILSDTSFGRGFHVDFGLGADAWQTS